MLEFRKNSFTTLFFTVQEQETPTAPVLPFDLTSATAIFAMAVDANSTPTVQKSSTSSDEIVITSATAGQLEVYINASDTINLQAGKYKYTLQASASNKEYNLGYDSINLKENISI